MANKHYLLGDEVTFISDLKNALINKYGAGVAIYYESTTYLIFSCAAISNKVIKVGTNSARFYYGDAWSSGTIITNEISFGFMYSGYIYFADLILGDNFLLIDIASTSTNGNTLNIVGRMKNGDYMVAGYGHHGVSSGQYLKQINTTEDAAIQIVTVSHGFRSTTGKLYKQPILITKAAGGEVESNADGSISTIEGLYNISYAGQRTNTVGTGYIITCGNRYSALSSNELATALFAEW